MASAECLNQILAIACNVFDAHTVALFLPSSPSEGGDGPGEANGFYRLGPYFSLSDNILQGTTLPSGKGLVGWMIRNAQPLHIKNFEEKHGILGYYPPKEEARIKAFMGCPLDQGLGAIVVDSLRTHSFSAKDQKILAQFARLIVSLYHDAVNVQEGEARTGYYQALELFFSLRAKHPRWQAFIKSVLELLSAATGFGHCFLAVRDPDGRNYHIEEASRPVLVGQPDKNQEFPIGSGVVGWVFKNHQKVVSDERDGHAAGNNLFGKSVRTPPFRSVLCLPLVIGRITRGVLVLANEESDGITPELEGFCGMVAGNLALFLENLYLKTRLAMARDKQEPRAP